MIYDIIDGPALSCRYPLIVRRMDMTLRLQEEDGHLVKDAASLIHEYSNQRRIWKPKDQLPVEQALAHAVTCETCGPLVFLLSYDEEAGHLSWLGLGMGNYRYDKEASICVRDHRDVCYLCQRRQEVVGDERGMDVLIDGHYEGCGICQEKVRIGGAYFYVVSRHVFWL